MWTLIKESRLFDFFKEQFDNLNEGWRGTHSIWGSCAGQMNLKNTGQRRLWLYTVWHKNRRGLRQRVEAEIGTQDDEDDDHVQAQIGTQDDEDDDYQANISIQDDDNDDSKAKISTQDDEDDNDVQAQIGTNYDKNDDSKAQIGTQDDEDDDSKAQISITN